MFRDYFYKVLKSSLKNFIKFLEINSIYRNSQKNIINNG